MNSGNDVEFSGGDPPSRFQRLLQQWDVIFLLIVFGYLTVITLDLVEEGRLYPLVFLGVALAALTLELFIEVVLPVRYAAVVTAYLEGVTSEVESSFGEETESEEQAESPEEDDLSDQAGVTLDHRLRIAILTGLIVGYGLVSYLIGVFYAIPLFVFPSIYLVGSRSFVRAAIVTLITMVAVYFLFFEWMHVPVFDGVLLG